MNLQHSITSLLVLKNCLFDAASPRFNCLDRKFIAAFITFVFTLLHSVHCTAGLITTADAFDSAGNNIFVFSQHLTQDNGHKGGVSGFSSYFYRYDGTAGNGMRPSQSLISMRDNLFETASALRAGNLSLASDALDSAGNNLFVFSQHLTQDNGHIGGALGFSSYFYRYDGTAGNGMRSSQSLISLRDNLFETASALRAGNLSLASDALESAGNNLFVFSQHLTQDNGHIGGASGFYSFFYRYDGTAGNGMRPSQSLISTRNDFYLAANQLTAVPEPSSAMLVAGIALAVFARRKTRSTPTIV